MILFFKIKTIIPIIIDTTTPNNKDYLAINLAFSTFPSAIKVATRLINPTRIPNITIKAIISIFQAID